MTIEEILALTLSILPVRLLDGEFGLLIRVDPTSNEVGVQVPGENDIRWIAVENLYDGGNGALIEGVKNE